MRADPLGGWPALPADQVAVNWSDHALQRFGERCRPGLEQADVRRELSRLLASALVTRKPPAWFLSETTMACAYLTLGDEIVFPLHARPTGELVASTAIPRGMVGDQRRETRNRRRARRTRARLTAKRLPRLQGRRPEPPADLDEDAA